MDTKTRFIDKEEFLEAFSYLNKRNPEKVEQHLDEIKGILDSSDDAYDLLRRLDNIEDENIQSSCRRAALAQMYGVKFDSGYYKGSNRQNYISYCGNKIAVINLYPYLIQTAEEYKRVSRGSVILSKYGDIIVNEGVFMLMSFYGPCAVVQKIENGTLTGSAIVGDSSIHNQKGAGVYSYEGEFVIPFGIFDQIHLHLDGLHEASYKWLDFTFSVRGKITDIDSEDLNYWMKKDSSREFMIISPDNVVSSLYLKGSFKITLKTPNGEEFLDYGPEFLESIAPYRLTKERIQQELDRRK